MKAHLSLILYYERDELQVKYRNTPNEETCRLAKALGPLTAMYKVTSFIYCKFYPPAAAPEEERPNQALVIEPKHRTLLKGRVFVYMPKKHQRTEHKHTLPPPTTIRIPKQQIPMLLINKT